MENLTTKKKVAEVAATACWHKLINEIRKNIISFVRNRLPRGRKMCI